MGTRHLTGVQVDGVLKVAQYGQWDGYPSGQGATVLAFLHGLKVPTTDAPAAMVEKDGVFVNETPLDVFRDKVRACRWITDEETAAMQAAYEARPDKGYEASGNWLKANYPSLTRDTGAEILQCIMDSANGLPLRDETMFAADSVFCEWAYVVNLDDEVLEVYKGFNQTPLTEGERFAHLQPTSCLNGYYPVKLAATFKFSELPSEEVFCATLEPKDEDEETDDAPRLTPE
jgi:hypothetical protein